MVVFSAPDVLLPPEVVSINQSALRVTWSAPEKPNGDIVAYYIHVNDRRLDIERSVAGSYVLLRLQPFTVYRIQVHVHFC